MPKKKGISIEELNERLERSRLSRWGNVKDISILKASTLEIARILAVNFDKYIRIAGVMPDAFGNYVFSLPVGMVKDMLCGRDITQTVKKYLKRYKYSVERKGHYYRVTKS